MLLSLTAMLLHIDIHVSGNVPNQMPVIPFGGYAYY
jgi:hypothetical protein